MSRKLFLVLALVVAQLSLAGSADAVTRHNRARTAITAVTKEVEAAGYSNVRDVTSTGTGNWEATAERDGKTVRVTRTPDRKIVEQR